MYIPDDGLGFKGRNVGFCQQLINFIDDKSTDGWTMSNNTHTRSLLGWCVMRESKNESFCTSDPSSIQRTESRDSYHHLTTLSFIPHPSFVLACPINPHFRFPYVYIVILSTCVFMYPDDDDLCIVIETLVNNTFSESVSYFG